jgi:hypothetical protein
VKLARRSARFRADVARSKAERAAVDWAQVAADADAGITADFLVTVGGSTGWNIGLQSSQFHVSAAWAQLTMMYNGFADIGGAYAEWIATPVLFRSPLNDGFVLITPDKRWPQGATHAAQRTAGPTGSGQPPSYTTYPYNRVRTEWSPGDPWGESWYSSYRYKYIRNNSSTGPFPDFLKAEVNLLGAEAYLRLGDMTKGLAKLNISRVAAGLPTLTGTSINDPVPGADCVPRIPVAPTYTTLACGSIFEALKYEWRMEMAYNRLGAWFFAHRGWEDLVTGSPLFYPVPFEEMGARLKAYYSVGGGGYGTAPLAHTSSRSMAVRRHWILVVAGVLPAVVGCYTYVPLDTSAQALAGKHVAVEITDRGRAELGTRLGDGVVRLEGTVTRSDAQELEMNVWRVAQIGGVTSRWSGENVRFRRDFVAGMQARTLNKGRSYLVVGAAVVGVVLFVRSTDLFGSFIGGGDPPDVPPGQSSRGWWN